MKVMERLVALRGGADPRELERIKPASNTPRAMTFAQAADKWLKHIESEGAAMTGPLRYVGAHIEKSSRPQNQRRHGAPSCHDVFGSKQLDDVTPDDVA